MKNVSGITVQQSIVTLETGDQKLNSNTLTSHSHDDHLFQRLTDGLQSQWSIIFNMTPPSDQTNDE